MEKVSFLAGLTVTVLMYLAFNSFAHSERARLVDGNVVFVETYEPVTIITTTGTSTEMVKFPPDTEPWEVNLSTCAAPFANYDEWIRCYTKRGLVRKIGSMKRSLLELDDIKGSQEYLDLKQRYDWVLSFYRSLP